MSDTPQALTLLQDAPKVEPKTPEPDAGTVLESKQKEVWDALVAKHNPDAEPEAKPKAKKTAKAESAPDAAPPAAQETTEPASSADSADETGEADAVPSADLEKAITELRRVLPQSALKGMTNKGILEAHSRYAEFIRQSDERHRENGELKKQLKETVRKESESARVTPPEQPEDLKETVRPLLAALALDEEALPALEKWERDRRDAFRKELSARDERLDRTEGLYREGVIRDVRKELSGRFPGLKDKDTFGKVATRLNRLASDAVYQDAGETFEEIVEALMLDAIRLERIEEVDTEAEVVRVADTNRKRQQGSVAPPGATKKPTAAMTQDEWTETAWKKLTDGQDPTNIARQRPSRFA